VFKKLWISLFDIMPETFISISIHHQKPLLTPKYILKYNIKFIDALKGGIKIKMAHKGMNMNGNHKHCGCGMGLAVIGHLLLIVGAYVLTWGLIGSASLSVVLKSPVFWGIFVILSGMCFLKKAKMMHMHAMWDMKK